MNELKIFTNKEFGEVRTVIQDGDPWFAGRDVAVALGYTNPQKAIRDHVDDEDRGVNEMDTPSGKQNLLVINESGLYSLAFGSKLESAKRFKHWVTSEVLPTIRKAGSYNRQMTPKEVVRAQLEMMNDHEERLETLENTMTVDYGQQQFLKGLVNRIVVEALGGKSAPAYHEISKKVFSECNHDIQDFFQVNSRNNIPRVKYDEAKHYIRHWSPCTNTQMLINSHNAQMAMAI